MSRPLVIVESPAKAKTIARHLGGGYDVRASVGHIADLPTKGLGVDVDNGFKPEWELTSRGKEVVKELRSLLKDASELYLATDEDREGEIISWHLLQHLKPKVPVKRMVFHEITQSAITDAVAHPRDLDEGLVDAAETRRILDRLYGWEVSPVLWRRVNRGLAGGPGAEPGHPPGRGPGAGAHGLRGRLLLGPGGPAGHRAGLHRHPGRGRRRQGGDGEGLRPRRPAQGRGRRPHRGAGRRAGRRADRPGPRRPLGRGEALPVRAQATVHDVHAAAGGRPQAAAVRAAGDAPGPGALRARVHHLHADRLRDPLAGGPHRGAGHGGQHLRRPLPVALAPPVHDEGEERAGGPRGHPARRRPCARRSRCRPSSTGPS